MYHRPDILHAFLDHLTTALITYVGYQIEAGAQVVQLFDSWAHHLTPDQFAEFSLPYANRIIDAVRAKYPDVPLIFHANGGKTQQCSWMQRASARAGLTTAAIIVLSKCYLGGACLACLSAAFTLQ